MVSLLRNLPFHDRATTVEVRGRSYRILPNQIVVWVSLARHGQEELDPRTPRFPAVLDTGFTDNFLIHEQQLREFAGLAPEGLRSYGDEFRARGRRIPIRAANLWLHQNRPGERDLAADTAPFLLELERGIGISSGADPFPRLPLLGARALRRAQLQLLIDYARCRVSLRTRTRFWFLNWW